jgi:ribonuclease HI
MTSTSTSTQQYVLYFDGGSSGNPGPAGSGSVLYDEAGVEIWADSYYVGDWETNNTAEYTGLLRGLEEIVSRDIQNVRILGDSQLVIRQMKGEYKVSSPHLQVLHAKAQDLVTRVPQIDWQHIPRALNKRADALSRVRALTDR